ncbi:MAG: hypothetical protein AABY26_02540 [Nanoarchaeota archaeon]
MKKNKRGDIVVNFLVITVLALILFASACTVLSKFFRLSEQSKDSFKEFTNDLLKMGKAQPGDRETTILILDEATAAVYFEPYQTEVQVAVSAESPRMDYIIKLTSPGKCALEKGCLCLFQKPEFDVAIWTLEGTVKVSDSSALCQAIDVPLKIKNCGIGVPNDVNSYTCSKGFFIERHLADKSSWAVNSYYDAGRRTSLQMERFGDMVMLEG